MDKKIVLIDGNSIMNRAFYGVPNLTNSKGVHTNAIFGFLNIMFKVLDEEKPEYLLVAFDVHAKTFRHEMYEAYKGTRKGMPDELKEQMPLIHELLTRMNISICEKAGYEADDILGTYAECAKQKGMEVRIISGDRDMLQLSDSRVLIRIPKTGRGGTTVENYYPDDVVEKYGVTPAQIIELKALMGDSSDNIPGVPGVGEKTAVALLKQYPDVKTIYENIEGIEKKRTKTLLLEGRESAEMSKALATIDTHADIDVNLEETIIKDMFNDEAYLYMRELDLKSFLKKFNNISGQTHSTKDVNLSDYKIIKLTNESELNSEKENIINAILSLEKKIISFAVIGEEWSNDYSKIKRSKGKKETQITLDFSGGDNLFDTHEEALYEYDGISVSIGDKIKKTYLIVGEKINKNNLLKFICKLMQISDIISVSNVKNLLHLITPYHCDFLEFEESDEGKIIKDNFNKIFDISIASYLLNPLADSYTAPSCARLYLGIEASDFFEIFGKDKYSDIKYRLLTDEKIGTYYANESAICIETHKVLYDKLSQTGMLKLFKEIEIPTAYYLYTLEQLGIKADKEELHKMSVLLGERIDSLTDDIYNLAGEEFNINSPKQLGVILFEKLKLPGAKKTKTGYSTAADVLEKLKGEDPIIDKILEYRQLSKLKSTYADGLAPYIGTDGRIHGSFNQTITATGRISSTDPNLQNIPVRMELGRRFRGVFKPKDGCVFLDADFSQIELRLMAHMSGDKELIDSYKLGEDIHAITASKVFHVPFEEVTPIMRRNAKAVNFGIIYGISSFGLGQDLNISGKQAKEYIEEYFKTYPDIKKYLDKLVEDAKTDGYTTTIFGRRRPIPELKSSNHMQRAFGERVAMNAPIQGSAADIMKIAMINVSRKLYDEGLKSRVVLQVHDELLVETYIDEKDKVKEILVENMKHAAKLLVELEVSVSEGSNWDEAH